MRVLYISYGGLMEPLGQSQVLQYLKRLALEHEITLVTYEKKEDWNDSSRRQRVQEDVSSARIRWSPLRYHRRPTLPATAFDLLRGVARCRALVVKNRIQIVHARSYVPSLIALWLKRHYGLKYVFDMRGFWADERIDAGCWASSSPVYRAAKAYECRFLRAADVVVSLTRAGVAEMMKFPCLRGNGTRFEVIPTCANLEMFNGSMRLAGSDMPKPTFTLGYVGTTTGWYEFAPVLTAYERLRQLRPAAKLLIINKGQHDTIWRQVRAHGLTADHVEVKAVEHAEVPREMAKMDATAFFIKPVFSKRASAPTKLGEFLGCGVPCLTNAGVGDTQEIIEESRVGVVIPDMQGDTVRKGVEQLVGLIDDQGLRARCVSSAKRHFSLEHGVVAYDRIYKSLAG